MKFTNVCLAVMLSLLVMVFNVNANPNDEPSVRGRVYNNCGFTVYMRQAIGEHPGPRQDELCRGFGETQEVAISPRTYFETPLPVYQDSCGHSIKVARTPGSREVYQYEFTWARENNMLWYNLSHNDGNPFVDVARQIGGPEGSTCSYIRCQAGENGDGCDDPLAPMPCSMIGTPIGYLC